MKKIRGFILAAGLALGFLVASAQPTLAADASIAGKATKATSGAAVNTLLIYAENTADGTLNYAYTDTSGNYTITITDSGSGTAGTYTVYNSYYNYGDTSTYYIKQTQTVTLVNGQAKAGVNFSVDTQGKIIGHVYASNGTTPLYNAAMFASATLNGNTFYGSDTTTAAGYYSASPYNYNYADQVNNGTYTVTSTLSGYFGASKTVDVTKNTSTTLDFSLTKGSTVSGKLTKSDGSALSGATATLAEVGTRTYTTTTDSAGNYTIQVYDAADYGGTAVGYYTLTVSATNYVPQSQGIHITSDESTLTGYNATLAAAGSISGTVYQADGTTALGTATVAANDGFGNTYSTTSAANGTYTLSNLRVSSNYTLTISKDGYVTQKVYQVTVTQGQAITSENITLAIAVSFTGTLIDKDTSAGVEGITISLYNLAKPRTSNYTADYTATSYTNGSFTVPNIMPGTYRVKFTKAGYITLKKQHIDLTASVTGNTYTLAPATLLLGQVLHNNKAVPNALVSIYSTQDSDVGYGSAYTDSKGFYSISNIKPGTYLFRVTSTNYADKIVTRHVEKNLTTINIKIGAAGSVSGFAYDATTKLPIASLLVKVQNKSMYAYTDSNGYYIIDGLKPGSYQVSAFSSSYDNATKKNIRVKANKETKNINFSLAQKK